MSQRAASSGQYRAGVEVDASRGPGRGGRWPADPARRTGARSASNPSIVSPEPMPTTPSSVSTRTIVTGNAVRGHRIPGRRERRVERDPQALEPDRGDAHGHRSIPHATRWGSLGPHADRPADRAADRATALDRPPEEAAEDTSFARGLRVLLTIADRGEIRADELSIAARDADLDDLPLPAHAGQRSASSTATAAGYRLGPRLVIGRGAVVTSEELIRVADPILEMLAEETGETAIIVRRVGSSAVCLHEVPSRHALRVEPGAGLGLAAPRRRPVQGPPGLCPAGDPRGGRRRRGPAASPRPRPTRRDSGATWTTILADGRRSERGRDRSPAPWASPFPSCGTTGSSPRSGSSRPPARASLAWRTRVTRLLQDAARTVAGSLGP